MDSMRPDLTTLDLTTLGAIGSRGMQVTPLGFGGGTIGAPFVEMEDAVATVRAAWDSGVRFFDTAPWYGIGRSERRLGVVLESLDAREAYAVNTKVGKTLVPEPERDEQFKTLAQDGSVRTPRDRRTGFRVHFDYTYDGVLAQHHDSRQRLGLAAVDSLTIHDLDWGYQSVEQMQQHLGELSRDGGGGAKALEELREAGAIRAIGIGCNLEARNAFSWEDPERNHEDLYERIMEMVDLDFFIVAGGYTLLEQRALRRLLPLCESRGIRVVIAAPYASGWLAAPSDAATYMYAPAPAEVVERSRQMQAICDAHDVPLAAAALQFPLAHPAVATVIPGAKTAQEASENAQRLTVSVPTAVWSELKEAGLLDPSAPTPG
ncbi:MAG: D-threo-aldose 1-dehydrogenase [Chloroflexi bacterium]|nr:MAG: D-threo-aldose 1-dehydrogenase [Chloroflexota bacterium]